jgi:predicted nucleic acid-binding protein
VVLIDSDVMMTAYRVDISQERSEVRRLIELGEAATSGIVCTEILRGARSDQEFVDVSKELQAMEFLEDGQRTWLSAARILYDLKRQGQIIPLADALIAAQAIEFGCAVYTHDKHFERIQGLRLHEVS